MAMTYAPPLPSQVAFIKDAIEGAERAGSQFVAFRRFYHEITQFDQTGDFRISMGNRRGLASHSDVLRAVSKLQSKCKITLDEFQNDAFPDCLAKEREKAVKITVQLAFMINPSSKDGFPMAYRIEKEVFPVKWLPDQTFIEFFNNAFPTELLDFWHPTIRRHSLKAWKLKKMGIQICPTNDLAEHLVYHPNMNTLSVFHQVEYLKAQIRLTMHRGLEESIEQSLDNGTLPPQLLFETLYTIYYILFPLAMDKKSAKLAKKLTRAKNDPDFTFDPNLLEFDGLILPLPDEVKFVYWTKRLRALQVIVNEAPTNRVLEQLESRLPVAILGLFLTALFGLLGVIVGVAQLVVSLKQSNLNS